MAGEFRITDTPCGRCARLMVVWGRMLYCPGCQAPDGSYRKHYYAPHPRIPGMPGQRTPPKNLQSHLL